MIGNLFNRVDVLCRYRYANYGNKNQLIGSARPCRSSLSASPKRYGPNNNKKIYASKRLGLY